MLAIGTAAEVRSHPAWASARPIDLPGHVVAPALVNAHTHLDLSHIGPRPIGIGGFAAWINMVRTSRHTAFEQIAQSVRLGVEMLLKGGTVAAGDIAGSVRGQASLAPAEVMAEAGLLGVSFLEFFALSPDGSPGLDRALELAEQARFGTVETGLEPHAPYSASLGAYRRARDSGLRRCTHLAESMAERQAIGEGSGPIRDMLAGLGLWNDGVAAQFGHGKSAVGHLEGLLDGVLAVHLNDLSNADIDLLAGSGVLVAYCPRASAYFGAPETFGPHRYRDLLAAGVPVALGTDSVVNLPLERVESRGICVLDEAGLLLERDSAPPGVLLEMLYRHGPAVLGLSEAAYRLEVGADLAGLIAVEVGDSDPIRGFLGSSGPVCFL